MGRSRRKKTGLGSTPLALRRLPNLITGARLVLTPVLAFVPAPGAVFYAVYLLCGLSDMLDGWLARKTGGESRLGAYLDSAADFALIAVLLWKLFPVISPSKAVVIWVLAIAAVRLMAAFVAYLRHGVFSFLHTSLNKLTGLLLFFYPLSLGLIRSATVIYFLCALATVSAAEELMIDLKSEEWDPNRKSIISGRRKRAL